jgi:signal peptidase I
VRISRELVHAVIGIGVLAIMIHAWLLQGLVARVVVASGSMAPHLVGPHRQGICGHCGHSWKCNRESLASVLELTCPQCGTACDVSEGRARPGDRVLVDRSAFLWRSPRRWEAVVFQPPEEPGALGVKRVAGLPGESVQLRGGDVFVNGMIARKSIAEQRATAIGVYELPQTARDEVLQRWRAEPAESWQFVSGRFVHRALPGQSPANSQAVSTTQIDWLGYYHRQCFRSNEKPRLGPILDESSYDPSESRVLCPVSDVILRCRMTASPCGAIYLRATAGGDEFTIEVDPDRSQANLVHNREPAAAVALPSGALGPRAQWEVMLADHQLLLAIDDCPVIEFRYQPIGGALENQAPRVAIGARGAEVELRDLQILRDIYYTTGSGASGETGSKYQLGPDEYFLLGDNSPHSLDSRVWSPHDGISARSIVGRAVKW